MRSMRTGCRAANAAPTAAPCEKDKALERDLRRIELGQAAPARIVVDQAELLGEAGVQRPPDGRAPVKLDMGEPGPDLHHGWAVAAAADREAHAVASPAEGDLLRRRGRLIFRLRSRLNIPDEPEALAQDGADQPLLVAAVAQRAARGVDAGRQRRFRHDTPVPDGVEQLVLGDDTLALADEVADEVEHLRLDRDDRAPATQFAASRIEREILEIKCHNASAATHATNRLEIARINVSSSRNQDGLKAKRFVSIHLPPVNRLVP